MTQLFGRYELLRKVAAGGMAEIFLARQWGEGGFFRDVVIKRIFRNLAENEKQLRMFQDEARLLAELCHPNIPQVFELGVEERLWFMAMEWVDGHDLSDLASVGARSHQPMPLAVAIGVVMQACEALHHAHERRDKAGRPLRIVHRDVTPQNLMVTRDGVVKLLDFGIARTAARRETDTGVVKGTFSYMAPEQVRARPLDKRADVFALGVILYELTTGVRLFRGSDVQVMTQVVEQDAPRPTVRFPDYPEELERIVLNALQRDRGQRTPSASHLALALEEFATKHGMLVGPRAVSRHVLQVFPYERLNEERAGIVEAPQGRSAGPARGASESGWREPAAKPTLNGRPVVHEFDDESLFDDLHLLGEAPRTFAGDDADPLTLPPQAHRLEVVSDDTDGDLLDGDALDGDFDAAALLESLPPAPLEPARFDDLRSASERASSPEPEEPENRFPSLPPELFELDDGDASGKPVVLLASPKRALSVSPGAGEYMRDLLRRLEKDEDPSDRS
jgi:tRNA A-37 threonylcarbamoyl transferase component Bud32